MEIILYLFLLFQVVPRPASFLVEVEGLTSKALIRQIENIYLVGVGLIMLIVTILVAIFNLGCY